MPAALRRLFNRLFAFLRSTRAERELAREIEAHLRLLEDEFVAQGMTRAEAGYAAKRAFGGVEQAKEHQRDARSFRWLHGASLDFKLGVRMLIKYPGLTAVGGVSIALGIAVGVAAFEFLTQVVAPTLPLDDGDRIVVIRNWDAEAQREEPRLMHDLLVWREQLSTIEDVGAYRSVQRNLIAPGLAGEPIEVAEITASAFRLAGRSAARTRARRRGRARRRARGARHRSRRVAAPVRRRRNDRRPQRADRKHRRRSGGGDAGRVCVPRLARRVDATADRRRGLRAVERTGGPRLRAADWRRDDS